MRAKSKSFISIIIIMVVISATIFSGCSKKNIKTFEYFGTFVDINLANCNSSTIKLIEDEIKRIDEKFSVAKPDSVTSRINSLQVGVELHIDEETAYLLNLAKKISRDTNYEFDLTRYELVDLWGFSPSKSIASVPNHNEISQIVNKNVTMENIILQGNVLHKDKQLTIDFGSIVKGYAVQRIKEIAVDCTGLINIGGNLYALGGATIGIQNPRESSYSYNGKLEIENTSICTSGDYERYFIQDGKRYHHIIGKNGYPCNNYISVTIISEDATIGDALSTAVFLTNNIEDVKLLASKYNVAFVLITSDKKVTVSDGLSYQINDKEYTIYG